MASKEFLFDRYSKNLQKVFPELKDKYVCPLTFFCFDIEQIAELSIEHCILDGLGENAQVLTFEEANNRAGGKIDFQLHNLLRRVELFRDCVGSYPTRITIGDLSLGVDFTRNMTNNGPHNNFFISNDRSNPRHVEESRKWIESGKFPDDMKISLDAELRYRPQHVNIALIKICYLMLFRLLGYSLIFEDPFDTVRSQIANPDVAILPLDKIVRQITPDEYVGGLLYISEPEDRIAFGIDITLRKSPRAAKTFFRIFIPCSTRANQTWQENEQCRVRIKRIRQDIDYIENPRLWFEHVPIT